MARAVIDTNVIVSGAIASGIPRSIWSAFKANKFKLIISLLMLKEVTEVLRRPKFSHLIEESEIIPIILSLERYAEVINSIPEISLCRDPEDNHILGCALASKADFIVTGDKDLLVLKTFPVPIITSREFLSELKNSR